MAVQEVTVFSRETTGKEASGRLRRQGFVPGVIYGMNKPPRSVSLDPKVVNGVLQSEIGLNTLLVLKLDQTAETGHAMIKTVDRHPVTDRLLHVDLIRVDVNKEIELVVPIEFVGEAPGLKFGGIFNIVRRDLEVSCLPTNVVGQIQVDISHMEVDDNLRVENVQAPEGVRILTPEDQVLAAVVAPMVSVEGTEAEEAGENVAAETTEEAPAEA